MSGEAIKAGLEVGLEAGLKTTAAHVFGGVAGGVRGGADFDVGAGLDVAAAFNVNVDGAGAT